MKLVVVGYGVVKKSDLTGSVGSVNPKQFLPKVQHQLSKVYKTKLPE